jgi:pterin-4a-carbinolamine dehydratase
MRIKCSLVESRSRGCCALRVRSGAVNHHPEWINVFKTVAVRLCTHDAGGKVTEKDVELARRLEKVAG